MMYMCICDFKHLFSHELVLNSNSNSNSPLTTGPERQERPRCDAREAAQAEVTQGRDRGGRQEKAGQVRYMARNMFGSIDVAILNHCMRTGGWETSAIDRQAPGNRSSKSITTNCW